jgi:hypothetical protein
MGPGSIESRHCEEAQPTKHSSPQFMALDYFASRFGGRKSTVWPHRRDEFGRFFNVDFTASAEPDAVSA